MRSVYELLDTVEQLLKNGWVQNREAVDKDGHRVDPWSDLAVRYCVRGGVRAVTWYEVNGDHSLEKKYTKFMMSTIDMANSGIMNYDRIEARNDQTSQEVAVSMVHRTKEYVAAKLGTDYIPNWLKENIPQLTRN